MPVPAVSVPTASDLYRVSTPGANQVDAVNRRPVPLQMVSSTGESPGPAAVTAANVMAAKSADALGAAPPPGYVSGLASLAGRAGANTPRVGANLDMAL